MAAPLRVVDTSAWIEYLRATGSKQDLALGRALQAEDGVLMPAVVLQELLQGARSPQHYLALQLGFTIGKSGKYFTTFGYRYPGKLTGGKAVSVVFINIKNAAQFGAIG